MTGWNFADVYEAVAARVPERPCQVQGERTITWAQFDARADALAADFLDAGLTQQSKVAAYLYNCPEYLETYVAAFKGGFAPVNTNYRYAHDEIVYLFRQRRRRGRGVPCRVRGLLDVVRHELPEACAAGTAWPTAPPVPDWATDYEAVVARPGRRPGARPVGRSGDDLLLLYTGGTTGMPKGVMWRQDDLFNVLGGGGNAVLGIGRRGLDELARRLSPDTQGFVLLSACPLMHGTGQFSSLIAMNLGGCVVSPAVAPLRRASCSARCSATG
jgi:acyl-CoA synthetase (AMP-forming)/AMP-acid ligase II